MISFGSRFGSDIDCDGSGNRCRRAHTRHAARERAAAKRDAAKLAVLTERIDRIEEEMPDQIEAALNKWELGFATG